MDIYAKHGTKVIFTGDVSQAQINWGGNDDPNGLLEKGKVYTLDYTEVHSYHTKVFLMEFPSKQFNPVWFEEV